MKNLLSIFILIIIFLNNAALSAEMLDLSVDSEIRKNYKVDDASLPPLPQIYYSESDYIEVEIDKEVKNTPTKQNVKATLKKGTKLKLRSLSQLSDKTRAGTNVSFVLLYPVSTTYMTIPSNTIFFGKVLKSHTPQFAGNGGMLIIKLTSAQINGKKYSLDGKVIKANSKNIFFNKIKGKRTYLSGISKSMTWGRKYKNKMYKLTSRLAKDKSTLILCPFSAIFGTIGYAGNLILSPLIAIKYKGKSVYLKKGTMFIFKLSENMELY